MEQPCILLSDYIRTLNVIADFVDTDTKDHSRNTRHAAVALAEALGWTGDKLTYLGYGADIHDIGKIAINPNIFRQSTKLTRAQYEAIKKHPEFGVEMIAHDGVPQVVIDCVKGHHEHCDGSGYPKGYTMKHIPPCARIVCIADVWESLTSNRPYRAAFTKERAVEIMRESQAWFDPKMLTVFLQLVEEGKV